MLAEIRQLLEQAWEKACELEEDDVQDALVESIEEALVNVGLLEGMEENAPDSEN